MHLEKIKARFLFCVTQTSFVCLCLVLSIGCTTVPGSRKIDTNKNIVFLSLRDIRQLKPRAERKIDKLEGQYLAGKRYNSMIDSACVMCPGVDTSAIDKDIRFVKKIKEGGISAVNTITQLAIASFAYNLSETGTFSISSLDNNIIEARLDFAYEKILVKSKKWEIIEYKVFIIPKDNGYSIRPVVDGRYASGIHRPKTDVEFRDMQPIHSEALQQHCKRLSTHIKHFMRQWKLGYGYKLMPTSYIFQYFEARRSKWDRLISELDIESSGSDEKLKTTNKDSKNE
ncbi:MAG: hypothetical protein GY797_21440 [Deltaproteobacteria bacterium]|nr:hypothetical protein [Deltaproteobacteria bacterium]